MIWTTVLNPAIDIIYPVENMAEATTFTDVPTTMYPAGKGLNFAKVVRELGEEVSVVILMPEADSERFKGYMEEHGIGCEVILIPGSVRVNTTIVDEAAGFVQHFNSRGAECSPQIQARLLQKLTTLIAASSHGDAWVLSGSLPRGLEPQIYGTIIEICSTQNIPVTLDTRNEALAFALPQIPTIISPNSEELSTLFDEPLIGMHALLQRGLEILSTGVETLFITLGEDGVLGFEGNEILRCKSKSLDVVDTVGCGDAFLAGVMVAKKRGFSFVETCRLGVACGAANALNKGPGEVIRSEVTRLMEEVVVEEIKEPF